MGKKKRRHSKANHSHSTKIDATRRPMRLSIRMREVLVLSSLALLVFLIYSNSLGGPFLFDDNQNIQKNPHIRLTSLGLGGVAEAGFESPSPNRPVANISFALNYYVHQYHVLGYHLVNVIIHIMTGILLYLFVKTTLNLPSLRSRYEPNGWIPFVTALVWLVHPVQTQSVTYMVQRMNSMAAMFYVLSFFLYAKARLAEEKGKKRALFGGSMFAGILALGSKEIAATLPFFIFLYEWYFFQDLSWKWLKRHVIPLAALFILLAVVALMYLGVHPFEKILNTYAARDFTLTQRVLTEFRVVIYYISLLIFPHPSRLNLDHDFPISHSLVDPLTTLLSLGTIVALIGLAIYLAKKDRLLSFCILWFLGNLVIESSVIGLEIIFEHRIYLPSMLVVLIAVMLAFPYMKHKWQRVGTLCAVVLVFSFWTYQRNSTWSDHVTLWRDCANKSPKNARPHYNLGVALASQERLEDAISHYSQALRIKPDDAEAHNNLGVALASQGKLNEAIGHYSEALRIDPRYLEAHNNLGVALARQGKLNEAISHYSEALRIKSHSADVHYNLANALKRQGRLKEAVSHYSEALRVNPDYKQAHNNLGIALATQGKLNEAIGHYSEALRINPDYEEGHYNLGNALKLRGKLNEAISHFAEVLRINPDHGEAHYKLGNALASQGRLKEAVSHFSEALRIKPDHAGARRNLERGLSLMGRSVGHSNTVVQP